MTFSRINQILRKISGISAILLFLLLLLYFFSGVFLMSGKFDYILMTKIHNLWLPLPTFLFFLLHSLIEIKFLFLKLGFKDNILLNLSLLILGIIFLSLFLYYLW